MKNIKCIPFILISIIISNIIGAQRKPTNLTSPEVLNDNSVIFRLHAPSAKDVKVVGTWSRKYVPNVMEKKDTIWEVKVGPIPSDMYEYDIVVDGLPMLDPLNKAVTRDGAYIQSRLMIPGGLGDLIDVKPVPHGDLKAVWYDSPTVGTSQRRMHIYTPPGYDKSKQKYPVLYLLHGGGGDEEVWISRGRANYILDNLIANGKAVPMVVVITNGDVNNIGAVLDRPANLTKKDNTGIGAMAAGLFEQSLVKDIIPYIEKNYRVKTGAENRALTGFSMGGLHTQNITNDNPTFFKYIGVMSMGLWSAARNEPNFDKAAYVAKLIALQNAKPKVYWIGMGTDDFLYNSGVALRKVYDEIRFKYTYRENVGSHDWNSWRMYLTEFAPLCFK
jgi:enterochelin esterase-like enzyme